MVNAAEASGTSGGATVQMPFGRFFGTAAEKREIAGFTLTRFVPTVPKSRVQWHAHEEAHFVFVLRGWYETSARPAHSSPWPRLIYTPPGTPHRDCFAEEDLSRSEFATLSVSSSALAAVESETRLPAEAVCLPESAVGLARQILAESVGAHGSLGSKSRDDLSACITEALCLELLQRTGAEPEPSESGAPVWLRRARELLHDTCLEEGPRTVREIAGELGVHPVYLARRFRQSFGMTPGEYLRRCRLDRARWLLRRSSAGLAEIAAATGFTDQSHFSNAFRKGFGVSPGVYRRT